MVTTEKAVEKYISTGKLAPVAMTVHDLSPLYAEIRKLVEQVGMNHDWLETLVAHAYMWPEHCKNGVIEPCRVSLVTIDHGRNHELNIQVVFSHELDPNA